MEYDFNFEYDEPSRRYLVTPTNQEAKEWLDGYATAASEWWGKSLMVSRPESAKFIDAVTAAGLKIRYKA